jgi:hypothetical protein
MVGETWLERGIWLEVRFDLLKKVEEKISLRPLLVLRFSVNNLVDC